MKTLSAKKREMYLKRIMAIKDEDIDTSDIPELTIEQLRSGVRGLFYRPIKKPVTIRLDADVIEWLKEGGAGYQTKANRLLRNAMIDSHSKKEVRTARSAGLKRKKSGTDKLLCVGGASARLSRAMKYPE
jgi:uncharacterized protein (DUF4415 family)